MERLLVWERKIQQVGLPNVIGAVELLMEKAKEGDFQALKLFLELFLPPNIREKTSFFDKSISLNHARDFDELSDRILSLAGQGKVALKDAEKMMAILEGRRKCFEMNELSNDVDKLKKQISA
jgi:hypothetical protein